MPIWCSIRLADLRAARGVAGAAVEHPHQGLDRVGVAPVVVQALGRVAADRRHVRKQPRLAAVDGRGHGRAAAADFQQGRYAQRRDGRAEGQVGPGHGGVDLVGPAAPLGAPRAVGVLSPQQEGDALADGRIDPGGGRRSDGQRLRANQRQRILAGGGFHPGRRGFRSAAGAVAEAARPGAGREQPQHKRQGRANRRPSPGQVPRHAVRSRKRLAPCHVVRSRERLTPWASPAGSGRLRPVLAGCRPVCRSACRRLPAVSPACRSCRADRRTACSGRVLR